MNSLAKRFALLEWGRRKLYMVPFHSCHIIRLGGGNGYWVCEGERVAKQQRGKNVIVSFTGYHEYKTISSL